VIAAELTNLDVLMLVIIFVLLLVLVFLSVAEMGLSRMTKPKAQSLADRGEKSGRALVRLVSDPERWVNPLLLTVNICQTVQATLTGIVAASLFGAAGVIECVAGTLITLGLFTRPAAFIASGMMAYAYFTAHLPNGLWPIVNRGEPAVMNCLAFLYMAARGSGPLSADALRK